MSGDFLTPEEVQNRRERKKVPQAVNTEVEDSIDKNIQSYAGCVRIDYESMGRFSTPPILYFKDYNTDDINDLVMSSQETIVETLIPILNRMKFGEEFKDFDCASMTIEDFIETLIAIKKQYHGTKHKHPYMCECQYAKFEADQESQEGEIDLNSLNYKSIEQVEEEYRNQVKLDLDQMTEEEWTDYQKEYATSESLDIAAVTKEYIISKINIKEPFIFYSGSNKISFRLTRIADVIKAQKMLDKEYSPLIKKIQNRTEHGMPGAELQEKKKKEIENLEKEKTKKLIVCIKAFSLISLNDQPLSDNEKIKLIKDRDIFPNHVMLDLNAFLDQLKHGVFDEKEFTCPICGKINKESLQYSFAITELLPLNSKSERDNRQHTRLDIRFGA